MEKFDAAVQFLDSVVVESQEHIDDNRRSIEADFNLDILGLVEHTWITAEEGEAKMRAFHNTLWGIEVDPVEP